ncbi:hypothetical protein [Deinococcus murrayi]|uniref:hypothetical protein n=1 Tax=Deinococcus murrayi TaxID=68910 RepID=UPI000484FA7F|nr:hypothetical protein [Deinococcus murrayi]
MKNLGRLSLLTATMLLGLGTAFAQTQTPPATPPATEQTPAPVLSQEATLTIGDATITIPGLQDATLVKTFSTVLGGGVIYRGSVLGSIDQIAQALTAAGFAAADGTGEAATDMAAEDADDSAEGESADTAAEGEGAASSDMAMGMATTLTGLPGLPEGEVRLFTRGGQTYELRAYERGGFTVIVLSRLGPASASN